jgi:hypothetical protein
MRLDGETIEQLYKARILTESDIRKINILNSLDSGVSVGMTAIRHKISKAYCYQLLKRRG